MCELSSFANINVNEFVQRGKQRVINYWMYKFISILTACLNL